MDEIRVQFPMGPFCLPQNLSPQRSEELKGKSESEFLMTTQLQPWEKSRLEVEIIDAYEAEIEGQEQKYYWIEFYDSHMRIVEAKLPIRRFRHFPHPTKVGTYFGLVIYKEGGKRKIGPWPLTKYWNPDLRKS